MGFYGKIMAGLWPVISSALRTIVHKARRSDTFSVWPNNFNPISGPLSENIHSANLNESGFKFIAAVKPFNFLLHLQPQTCG